MKERSSYIVKIVFINLVYLGRGIEKKKIETTKTFTVSATSPETAIKTAVKRLTRHDAFSVSEIISANVLHGSFDEAVKAIENSRKTGIYGNPVSRDTINKMRTIVSRDAAIDRAEKEEFLNAG